MQEFYDKFIKEYGPQNFIKGRGYNTDYIKLVDFDDEDYYGYTTGYFQVKSERTRDYYDVTIESDKEEEEFTDFNCTCPQYEIEGMCKHISACMINYHRELFGLKQPKITKKVDEDIELSKQIINLFYKPKTNKIRKKLELEITLEPENKYYYYYYYEQGLHVKYRLGVDRLYTLNGKFKKFISAYKNEEPYKLTQKFTYNADEYYFSDEDKEIIDFSLNKQVETTSYYSDNIGKYHIDKYMNLLKDKTFYIEGKGKYSGIKEENPFKINLKKEKNHYILKIDNIDKYQTLIDGYAYIYDNKNVYKLPPKFAKLYNIMKNQNLDYLKFAEDELPYFTDGILQIVKNNVSIDKSADNVIVSTTPKSKMYFDFYYNAVECKTTLEYANKTINILDKTSSIARDNNYETKILEKLNSLGFIPDKEKKRFLLEDIDQIGKFLEEELEPLSQEYEIFTSQKIKDTKIVKDTTASVNFSIGKDNIMTYNFNLEGVSKDELSDLLSSMNAKKKYYRLKSGDIIDLSKNEQLQEASNLAKDMELSEKELKEGTGTIPKYRAIYFDSLRKNNYNIISTNNLFDELINKFNSYKNAEITLTPKELKVLRDYQVTGVKWLYNIYKCGFGGILADEMGLGKSIQLIYLIKLLVKENPKAKILITAPTSLVYNWEKEFDKFGNELKYKVFAENKNQRLNELNNIENLNILITTYGLVRNDLETYSKINFDLVAIDEAQNIKNSKTQITKAIKSLNSNVKIALTGTPLENSVMELWSIFDFIMPGYLANNKKFQSLYNIKDMDEESMKKLEKLNTQITYFILRRKKQDVVKELPDKIENNIYIDLGTKQKKLYVAEVEKTKKEMDELIRTEGFTKARFKILTLINKLRQICIDPSIVFDNYEGDRAKIDELINVVKIAKENGHKVLVFTTYKTALDIAIKEFNNNGISAYSIYGAVSSKKRMELVEKFNSDDTDVFIITLKAGGTGLNLTSASVVVHLDLWWNPQVENQATDRAHRIGQKNTVEVIRLIARGTIEERILELQEKKKKLADALIEGELRNENQFANLTEKDIQMLLSMDNTDDVLQ